MPDVEMGALPYIYTGGNISLITSRTDNGGGFDLDALGDFIWYGTTGRQDTGAITLTSPKGSSALYVNGRLSVGGLLATAALDVMSYFPVGDNIARFGWHDYIAVSDKTFATFTSSNATGTTGQADFYGPLISHVNAVSSALSLTMPAFGGLAYSLAPDGASGVLHGSGMEYVNATPKARAAKASVFAQIDDAFYFYADNSLTAGNTYAPTLLMQVARSGTKGAGNFFGTLAVGDDVFSGLGTQVIIGGFGDAGTAYVQARSGNAATVNLQMNSKGAGNVMLVNSAGSAYLDLNGSFVAGLTLPASSAASIVVANGDLGISAGVLRFTVAQSITGSATAGAATLPATPQCFLKVKLDGTIFKIPVYNN